MFVIILLGDDMKISKFKLKKNGMYEITLEDKSKLVLYEDVILNNNILYKKEINKDLISLMNEENDYYKVYNKALNFITNRLRSEYEVLEYLNKTELDYKSKNKIINKLKEIGLINDKLFAKSYLYDKINLSNLGPNKVKKDLEELKVESSIIEEVINELDYDFVLSKLKTIIKKKIKLNKKYSNYMLKTKLIHELINKGFNYYDITSIIDNNQVTDNSIIEKEYNKIYSKLSQKYERNELLYKVRDSLYKKGYNKAEVNNFLNEKESL